MLWSPVTGASFMHVASVERCAPHRVRCAVRIWWMLGLLVVVGCSFDHGVQWDGATPDAPDVGNGDQDGDGVLDGMDNCVAVANADQRDHDADGRGDACDHCPHLASVTDPDTDGDGVGDACDPRP